MATTASASITARSLTASWKAAEAEANALDTHVGHAGADIAYTNYLRENPGEPFYHFEQLQPIRPILADQERRASERRERKGPPLLLKEIDRDSTPIALLSDAGDRNPFYTPAAQPDNPKAASARLTSSFWKRAEAKLGHKLDSRGRVELVIKCFEECSNQTTTWPNIFVPIATKPSKRS